MQDILETKSTQTCAITSAWTCGMLVKPVGLRQYGAFKSQSCPEAQALQVLLSTF